MNKKNSYKRHIKIYIFLCVLSVIIFLISTQYILSPKNSSGNIISINIYIVSFEIFLILFFLILTILDIFKKISFLNIVKNALLIPVTIVSLILLNSFSNLSILMIIAIPLSAIILYTTLSII